MKVLIITDKLRTGIDRLTRPIEQYLTHHQIKILPVHPKRPDIESLDKAVKLMEWCDILDIHYWKSGELLRKTFGKLFDDKVKILFHFNPYDADNKEVNSRYNMVVVGNKTIHAKVPYAYLIPYGLDLDLFKFNEDYTEDKVVNMNAVRIEGKKGVLEVARACKELGYKFKLVGRVSKPAYMQEVMEAGKGIIEFIEEANDEEIVKSYHDSAIHVCNSVDNFESGTMPILESMACGVPVLTRNTGHVLDLYDGKNMVVRKGEQNDIKDLKKNLKDLMENGPWRLKIRENAYKTVRGRDARRMAYEVNKLYWKLYEPTFVPISVIIPTRDNPEAFVESLIGVLGQDYKKFEVIVADSGDVPIKKIVEEARKQTEVPIKYIHFPHKGSYTLAEARNRAVIDSDGEWLVFCDDRIRMESNALAVFEAHKKSKTWLWGMKDGIAKGFVENFSFVNRRDLIDGGMFCERMQWYGGMSQEVRERFEKGRGFSFVFIQDAKAKGIKKAKSKRSRRGSIAEAKWLIYKMYN